MPTGKRQLRPQPSRLNLYRVWLIRSYLVGALLLGMAGFRWAGIDLPWRPLTAILVGTILVNVLLFLRIKIDRHVDEFEFFSNLLLDVGFLTLLLYFTGGSTNPLVSYYLIPVIVSAALLHPRYTWSIALLSIACYTLLFFRFVPLELFSGGSHGGMSAAHLTGMWINFSFSALLISWFVVRMAASVRDRDRDIARAREEGMRDEQIVSVASIAAGTAHELRTPLATMTLLVEELKADHAELEEDLSMLEAQLTRCDAILKNLISSTESSSRRRVESVRALFARVVEQWSLARPESRLEVELSDACSRRFIEFDRSLLHALMNFLNNAADVSPGEVKIAGSVETEGGAEQVLIAILDRGPGVPPEIAGALGREYVSRREGGLGMGVLLSSASIERLDGQVTLLARPGGGTRLEVRLPVQSGGGVESAGKDAS
jgi:two-component system sensor histidine kinase RegB